MSDKSVKSVECLKRNKVDDFQNLKVIKSKRQVRNLKRILTKAEFYQKQVGIYKSPEKRREYCASLLLGHLYAFKNVDKTFNLKTYFSCDSYNLLYIIICPTSGEEYTGETGVGKTKFRDRKPEYHKLKVEEHLRTCGKGTFKIFPLLQIRSSEI